MACQPPSSGTHGPVPPQLRVVTSGQGLIMQKPPQEEKKPVEKVKSNPFIYVSLSLQKCSPPHPLPFSRSPEESDFWCYPVRLQGLLYSCPFPNPVLQSKGILPHHLSAQRALQQ